MASIKLILRNNQQDKQGLCPLYIRIIKDRKAKFITTGIKLNSNEWDEEKQKVKKNHSNSARMNATLAQKIADASGMIADTERKSKHITARKLKEAIKGKDALNFFNYSYNKLEKVRPNYSENTYAIYKMQLDKFKKFVKDNELMFDDITVSLLKDYLIYLAHTLKNNETSQKLSTIVLSVMFKHAQEEELIPETLYPFNKLKLKVAPSKRQFLSAEQFEELQHHETTQRGKAKLYRDLFVFAVSAGGLRFSDVVTLRWRDVNLEEHTIRKEVKKTKRTHRLKFGQTALGILSKYLPENPNPEDFVFPAISEKNFFLLSEKDKKKIMNSCNNICGFHLRKIGKELGLPFTLSFHLSRHTFATMALNKGMRIEHVSKLMDHAKISTTQIYAKIIDEELDKAVDEFVI